jgi:hypothetical protein
MISTLVTADAAAHDLSLASVIGLILLLAAHEVAEPVDSPPAKIFRQNLVIFSIPLLVVFAEIVVMACAEIIIAL